MITIHCQMIKEKVYSVDNYWDMTILEGIADYNGCPHYYECVFSEKQDDWTNDYLLMPLSENIFTLGKEKWSYWLHWLATNKETKIPHPVDYAKQRKVESFEELATTDIDFEEWRKTEQNYQNNLIFDSYLKANVPKIKVKGLFSGQINGTDTFVEWTRK